MAKKAKQAGMTIFNRQTYTQTDRSEIVEITPEHIEEFKNYEPAPYTGETNDDLLDYLKCRFEDMDNGDELPDAPAILEELYKKLHIEVERTDLWSSLEDSGESELIIAQDGEEVATTDYTM